ncbi:replication initiator protein A [Sarcina ventriculi]|uniref:replication initiator protein A n=1 Tax=Sarcina ventriculi TaxID=1267 RepID=UPI00073EF250|nr:replication initiator protein A [Sarcina ventriculi]
MAMNYFNEYDCDQFKFYQLPKELYELEKYKNLSNDACVLYAMLRDRLQVSIKNNWIDEEGRVYFIFSRAEAALMIRKTKKSVIKYFNELINVDLLEEKIIEDGRAYRLYLGKIQNNGDYIPEIKAKKERIKEDIKVKEKIKNKENTSKNDTGVKITRVKNLHREGGVKITPRGVENLHPSNTNISNTKYIKKEKKKKSNFDKTIENYTDNEELREAILEFIKFRKGIKSILTDRALTLLLRNLDKFAKNDNEKIEIINQSILNGWKGIFPLKIDSKQNNLFNGRSRMDRSCDYL